MLYGGSMKIVKAIKLLEISNHHCLASLSCSPLITTFVKIVAFACRVWPVVARGYIEKEHVLGEEFASDQAPSHEDNDTIVDNWNWQKTNRRCDRSDRHSQLV
jgi:hypothetical protein